MLTPVKHRDLVAERVEPRYCMRPRKSGSTENRTRITRSYILTATSRSPCSTFTFSRTSSPATKKTINDKIATR